MTSRDQLSPMLMGWVGLAGILLSFSEGLSRVGPNTVARLWRDILLILSFSATLRTPNFMWWIIGVAEPSLDPTREKPSTTSYWWVSHYQSHCPATVFSHTLKPCLHSVLQVLIGGLGTQDILTRRHSGRINVKRGLKRHPVFIFWIEVSHTPHCVASVMWSNWNSGFFAYVIPYDQYVIFKITMVTREHFTADHRDISCFTSCQRAVCVLALSTFSGGPTGRGMWPGWAQAVTAGGSACSSLWRHCQTELQEENKPWLILQRLTDYWSLTLIISDSLMPPVKLG